MSFQKNLRHYREKAGYTAADFAAALGLPPSTYAGYEYKGREPKYDLLCKIADILKISLDDLLGRSLRQKDKILEKEVHELLQNFYLKNKEPFFIRLNGVENNTANISFLLKNSNDNSYCFNKDDQNKGRLIIANVFIDGDEIRYQINYARQDKKISKKDVEAIFFILLSDTGLLNAKENSLYFLRIMMEGFCSSADKTFSIKEINKQLSELIEREHSWKYELNKIERFYKLLTNFKKNFYK